MDVDRFLKTRPCLEELDGYLDAIRHQIEHPELYHRLQYDALTADVMGPIEKYRVLLMSGKETPAPTKLEREWIYKAKTKPKRKRITPNEQPPPDKPPEKTNRKAFHLDARRPQPGR